MDVEEPFGSKVSKITRGIPGMNFSFQLKRKSEFLIKEDKSKVGSFYSEVYFYVFVKCNIDRIAF